MSGNRIFFSTFLLLFGATAPAAHAPESQAAHSWAETCEDWDEWEKPGPAFKVYGNTYYVGTCGIGAILVTSDDGHVLIDSGTEGGAPLVLANIRELGFDPQDVKLVLNSHEHFDHVGGMHIILKATRAVIVSSDIGVSVMTSGSVHPDDPQFGPHPQMEPIEAVIPYSSGKGQFLLEEFGIWPISTPGHAPGAISWKWRACEGEECRTVVYADSLGPVSGDDYRFSDNPDYLADYRRSLARIEDQRCQILLTPHPSASSMREKLISGVFALQPDQPCRAYARAQSRNLSARLRREAQSE